MPHARRRQARREGAEVNVGSTSKQARQVLVGGGDSWKLPGSTAGTAVCCCTRQRTCHGGRICPPRAHPTNTTAVVAGDDDHGVASHPITSNTRHIHHAQTRGRRASRVSRQRLKSYRRLTCKRCKQKAGLRFALHQTHNVR